MRVLEQTMRFIDGAKEVHLSNLMFIRPILPIELLFSSLLGHELRGPVGSALVDDPPRTLLLSSCK